MHRPQLFSEKKDLITVAHAVVIARLDYCNKLNSLKMPLEVTTSSELGSKDADITPVLWKLHMLLIILCAPFKVPIRASFGAE